METAIFICEIIGIIAASVSGASTAIKKEMDLFGVIILGIVTAVGGGIFRDLILGRTPPFVFQYPIYALTAFIAAVIMFIPAIENLITKNHKAFDNIILIMDSIGLGSFTVVGARAAYTVLGNPSVFLAVSVGVITGVGGGVVRDIMAGEIPFILRKHFYAIPSIIGAVVFVVAWEFNYRLIAIIGGAAIIILLRLTAAKFRWGLPSFNQVKSNKS